jgi:hypothetical protein
MDMITCKTVFAKVYLILILAAYCETNILSSIFVAHPAKREALYLGLCKWNDCSAHFYFIILGPTIKIFITIDTHLRV